jgi:hypothetical protein
MQGVFVFLIVAAAAGYAAWLFLPQVARRWLIRGLMAVVPSRRAALARLVENAENAGCSSCKGCATDVSPPVTSGQARIVVHPRGVK